jgi:hypothetical protein
MIDSFNAARARRRHAALALLELARERAARAALARVDAARRLFDRAVLEREEDLCTSSESVARS